jgi:hypothetical protein
LIGLWTLLFGKLRIIGNSRWQCNQPFSTHSKIWAHRVRNSLKDICKGLSFKPKIRTPDYQGQGWRTWQYFQTVFHAWCKVEENVLLPAYLAFHKSHFSAAMPWR